jgi:predicted nuclease of predicted toxin-antitoxin system
MKFLCDVHISYKLVNFLNSQGYLAIHVNSILEGLETKDSAISDYAD